MEETYVQLFSWLKLKELLCAELNAKSKDANGHDLVMQIIPKLAESMLNLSRHLPWQPFRRRHVLARPAWRPVPLTVERGRGIPPDTSPVAPSPAVFAGKAMGNPLMR
ncbi:hypothetical protein PVAP13_5NG633650 [Panicum virgatum]|uniref:Uncharacterized protein n=1 Tax=Panicum virgatum TaxID=38727 RepID=A0A8T0SCY1_PANVG|nr:hypothetical protein PVAP13_5NG633650 [Panicum virgatum]